VLDDIKYHGLKSDRSVQPAKLEEQAAVTAGGVFERLCSVIQKSACPLGAVIKLKDVLSISPELGEVYERFFQEPPRSLGDYDTQVTSTSPFRMRVMTARTTMQDLLKRFPEVANDFELDLAPVHGYAVAFHSRPHVTEPPGYFKRYVGVVGGKYLVGTPPIFSDGTPMKLWISPPLSDYITMFILSDCVRYKQDFWGEVVQGRETGILGLIDLLIAVSRRRFTNLILDHLFGEHFDYGAPGRLM
jgi:hypothetical protein